MAANHAFRIVIVDDDVDTTNTLTMLLQMKGYEVIRCYAGADAIEKACSFHVEVVILDLAMPEVDGYEVARQLRQSDACKDTLLIAVTGYADEEHHQRAMQVGFDHYFIKPVDFAVLHDVLEAHKSRNAPPA
jgi:two-component system CheB/CheR fusion protein